MKQGECVHYNGAFHNDACAAGIVYSLVTPDSAEPGVHYRQPCWRRSEEVATAEAERFGARGECGTYTEPTAEQLQDEEAEMRTAVEHAQLIHLAVAVLQKRNEGSKQWIDKLPCPVCDGELTVTAAGPKLRTRGVCSNDDCLRWIE